MDIHHTLFLFLWRTYMIVCYCDFYLLQEQQRNSIVCVCEIGWRTRSSWWDECIGRSSQDLEQSTQFLDVDWWESKFLLLLFCWLTSKLYNCVTWQQAEEFSSRIQKIASQGSGADRELMMAPKHWMSWSSFVLYLEYCLPFVPFGYWGQSVVVISFLWTIETFL